MNRKWTVVIVLAFLILGVTVWLGGAERKKVLEVGDSDVFRYASDGVVDVGSLYHYHYSTIDGKQKHDLYMYIKEEKQIQYLAAAYSIYQGLHLFTLTFQEHLVVNALAENLLQDLKLPSSVVKSEGIYDYEKKQFSTKQIVWDKRGERKIGGGVLPFRIIPTFEYSMEGMDLGHTFRFLDEQAKELLVGLSVMGQCVDMDVRYANDEMIGGIMTRKYHLRGRGILAKLFKVGIDVWIARDDPRRYMVKYVGYLRRYPYFEDVKIELQGVSKMKNTEWEQFLADQVKKAKAYLQPEEM